MDGVLVIDKPAGLTSHDVVVAARRYLGESRVGHTGTLDPLATGVLALACGRATRLVRFLMSSTKDYEATVRFGVTTDSYDITGTETARTGSQPTAGDVEAALESLRGERLQTPPAFSAKKISGRRAYDMAREQRPVSPKPARVCLSRVELVDLTGHEGTFRLTCSAGYYVRSFAHDLGQLAGTGACLAELRRTRSGEFGIDRALPLSALQEDLERTRHALVPLHDLLGSLDAVRVTEEGRTRVVHGRDLRAEHLQPAAAIGQPFSQGSGGGSSGAQWVRIMDDGGALVALATVRANDGALHPAVVLI